MRFLLDLLIVLSTLALLEGGSSFVIQPKQWEYKGHDIGFEVARKVTMVENNTTEPSFDERDKSQTPILLLNGFGVGSFHQHRLIPRLLHGEDSGESASRVVYGIDYLGQGRSWPKDCQDGNSETEKGLCYSAETWLSQVVEFIEQVILPEHEGSTVHLVGNSVGGYLAAFLANARPDLVESIVLMNPTPIWGLNLPGWSGHLPAPWLPKAVGRYLFDQIRDLNTIDKYLENAYCRKEAYDEELMHQIRGCTMGLGGHAAFASILWSPPLKVSEDYAGDFQACLARLQCDVLLIFGADDPWCKPAFGKKMLQALEQRPKYQQRYVEIENAGHCPNHEAPTLVGRLIRRWVAAADRSPPALRLTAANEYDSAHEEKWGMTCMTERQSSEIPLSLLDRVATTFV